MPTTPQPRRNRIHAQTDTGEGGMNRMPGCWVHTRHGYGYRCSRLSTCIYPEKETCPAVEAEREYLYRQAEITKNIRDLYMRVANSKTEANTHE